MADADSSHCKIPFVLDQDQDGYLPYAAENLSAIQRADGYEVDNSPWSAKGIACGILSQPNRAGTVPSRSSASSAAAATAPCVFGCPPLPSKSVSNAPSYPGCGRNF